jgi:hypothetical protein
LIVYRVDYLQRAYRRCAVKTTGINKLFSKSPYFNKYYAVHIAERATAPIEVLSGCCMLVRTVAMQEAGGPFDEDYFMYCEDVDLSFRIQKAGYENIYFPEADLIHYKGESTRKMTLSYIRVFNEALVTFVKKHYSQRDARLFVMFINLGIALRAVLGGVKRILKIFHMPLLDALILLVALYGIKDFWVDHVKGMLPISMNSLYATFPVYIVIWLVSLYFSSAYDAPYRPLKVIRGMLIGVMLTLAYYGLLPPELRYSRAIIIFTGFAGTVSLLGIHEILYRMGILKFIPYDKLPKKAVIVADETIYEETAAILRQVHYAPELSGRISIEATEVSALAPLQEMKLLLYTTGINEVIFCVNGLTYQEIFKQMQHCGASYEYKIHLKGSQSFVGSNSSSTSGDLYIVDRSYKLSDFSNIRNKRMVDITCSLLLLLLLPFALFKVKNSVGLFTNIMMVISGKITWVGYAEPFINNKFPQIRKGVLPPYNIIAGYEPSVSVKSQINQAYAQNYVAINDLSMIWKNFKYLGIIR